MNPSRKSIFFYILCILLVFLGVNAFFGGLFLIIQPNGSLLGMQKNWLDQSPFSNYLIPGILLFTTLGLLPLLTFIGLIKKIKWNWLNALNIYKDRYWAWTFSIYSAIIAIIWITIQLIMTQYFWIQPAIIFNGIAILICALMPQVMKYFYIPNHH